MQHKIDLKYLIIVSTSTIFIIIFPYIGVYAYDVYFNQESVYSKGTSVGPVKIDGLTYEEAKDQLLQSVEQWRQHTSYSFTYEGQEESFGTQLFQVDLINSLKEITDGEFSPLLVSIDEQFLQEKVDAVLNGASLTENEQFVKDLLATATSLKQGKHQFQLSSYLSSEQHVENVQQYLISKSSIPLETSQEFYVSNWIKVLNPLTVSANSVFSLIDHINSDQSFTEQQLEALNIMATGVYETILPTNFNIIERHISRALPEYSKAGFEAKVIPNEADLLFVNPNNSDYVIKFQVLNKQLVVQLFGQKLPHDYEVQLKNKKAFKPKTILQYSAMVPMGQSVIKTKGKPGLVVDVYRQRVDENGYVIDSDFISQDFYPPIHSVKLHGLTGDVDQMQQIQTSQTRLKNEELFWGMPKEPLKGN